MVSPPGQSSKQPLPARELGIFRRIIKSYEQKQYRVGLRYARQILSNSQFADHGETLSMKGLILNCMGKSAEAQDCVKRGLKADLTSYVCWHVYGLVQRSDKKYDEAMKAYKHALNLDKENLQILRDLSLLQIQLRDYEGYRDSRYHLLRLRPTQRVSWVGYATAYHLLNDYAMALNIISQFMKNNTPAAFDFEHSELLLYQNFIIRESGQLDVALQTLEENSIAIVDRVAYMETRGNLLMQLGQLDKSEQVWRSLIDRNPENNLYYDKLEECLGLQEKGNTERLALYDELGQKYKKASVPKRVALNLVEGEQFRERLLDWMTPFLRKGAPSLFTSLVPLYAFPEKVAIIEGLINELVKKFEDEGYNNVSLDASETEHEPPTTALWLYLLAAQHYDRVSNTSLALSFVDRAIQHTPTLVENLMLKARIYKHAGDYLEAADLMDEAQSLDTADRYINGKCAKYLLRARKIEEATKMCAKFTREGDAPETFLNEMQCMWYEIECARAYRSLNDYGEALKKAHQIEQHFFTIVEDQYDFHTYCLRKTTLTAYVSLLRLEDVIRRHNYFYQAAKLAIKIYMRMIDRPNDMIMQNGINSEGLTSNELKKLKKKLKKQQLQKQEEEEKKKEKEKDDYRGPQIDAKELLKTEKPLEEAAKFAHHLHMLGSPHATAYALAADVYLRKKKTLLVLKCLNEGNKIDPNSPLLHVQKVKFLKYYETVQLTGIPADLAKEVFENLFKGVNDPVKLNEEFKSNNQQSLIHRLAVAEVNLFLDPSSGPATKNWLLKSFEDDKLKGRTLKNFIKFRDAISYGKIGSWTKEEVEVLTRVAHGLFPLSREFGGGVQKPSSSSG
ncbi:unnamed protein product [Caenorhabditis auriculariae]|uniref:Uncharacterized protein n=1 Tax=Caenorhabditis auriculariae TaxID=2777116 RepID=A0A8S1HNZ1_9PELO|nr:unnamed protein product [Caenorhabditis auriculariae]